MAAAAASAATWRPTPERVVPLPASGGWRRGALFLHLALWVPYLTSAVPALHQDGQFPVRPVFFMAGLGLANLAWIGAKRPDYPRLAFLLLALLALRTVDAALLQRQPEGVDPEQAGDALSHLANLFSAAVIFTSLGVFHRTGFAPVRRLAAGSILVLAGSIFAEFLGLCTYTTVPGRPSGFPGDANDAAMALNLLLGVYLSLSRRFWWNLAFIGLVLSAIIPTLSRGGFLNFSLIAGAYALLNLRGNVGRFTVASVLAVALGGAIAGVVADRTSNASGTDANARARLSALFGGEVDDLQSGERWKDLQDGLEGASVRPLTGLGTGTGQTLYQPHNQLVTVWIDLGLFAALVYGGLVAAVLALSLFSGFRAIYCALPLAGYIPLAQTLLDNHAYTYAAAVAMVLTATRFWSFRLYRPRTA
jgi:hypothetical protein